MKNLKVAQDVGKSVIAMIWKEAEAKGNKSCSMSFIVLQGVTFIDAGQHRDQQVRKNTTL